MTSSRTVTFLAVLREEIWIREVDSKVRSGDRGQVYRNWWTVSFGLVFTLFFGFIGVGLAIVSAHRAPWEVVASALFVATGLWFLSSASLFPCVRLRPDALVVDNFVFRYVIPWRLVRKINVSDGFEVVVTDWRESLGALGFSGSLIGAVTGYRTNNRVARDIETYRREYAHCFASGPAIRRLHVHPVSFVVWLVIFGLVVPLLALYA